MVCSFKAIFTFLNDVFKEEFRERYKKKTLGFTKLRYKEYKNSTIVHVRSKLDLSMGQYLSIANANLIQKIEQNKVSVPLTKELLGIIYREYLGIWCTMKIDSVFTEEIRKKLEIFNDKMDLIKQSRN